MQKRSSSGRLRTLPRGISTTTASPVVFTGERIEPVPCPASPSGACTRVSCASCTFVPEGEWACLACVAALAYVVDVLAYHADTPCHFCGALPLLTLRICEA